MNGYIEKSLNKNETQQKNKASMDIFELALFLLTLMLWSNRILMPYVRAVIMRLPVIGRVADELILLVYVTLIILALPRILKKTRFTDVAFGITVVFVYIMQLILFPQNTDALNERMATFLIYTLPLYFIGTSMDVKRIYPWLYRLSLITIVVYGIYTMFLSVPANEAAAMSEGDMWASYNLLPHVCLVLLQTFKKSNVLNIVVSVIGVFTIAMLGSRGPLLCLIIVAVLYLLFFRKYKIPILARSFVIGIGAAIVFLMDVIMQFLYDLSEKLGLSVRIFEKYFEGTISESSGRDVILEQALEMIKERLVLGNGLFADRTEIGTYCHNLIVELCLSFGVVMGLALLGAIVLVLIRASSHIKHSSECTVMFFSLLSAGFIKLFLSGSFTDEMYFFLLLGICMNIIRNYKSKKVMQFEDSNN